MNLPFRAEYAKSGRSSCKTCKSSISQGELRIAVMVQSHHHDGMDPRWHHFECFFKKSRPKTNDDIEHFESLRIEDQNRISERINTSADIIIPTKKGKKRSANEAAAVKAALKDYLIQYSVSARAICRGCELKIQKNEIRVSKKDYDSEIGRKFGGQDVWHHLECFAKLRSELGYFESADKLPGFKALSKEDQQQAKTLIPAIKQEENGAKKIKTEDEVDSKTKDLDKKYAEQVKLLYKFRDALKENFKKQDLSELLIYNKQNPKSGLENLLDQLADVMAFGALKKCPECKRGQLYFTKFGYECNGDLTEWTKCKNLVREPERVPFKIPKEYNLDEWPSFIKNYKYKKDIRVIKDVKPTVNVVKDETDAGPKIKRDLPALYDMEFVIVGRLTRDKDTIKGQITKLGGKLVSSIKPTTMAVISTEKEIEKMGSKIKQAETSQIHVVPEEFVDQAESNVGKIPELITKLSICSWGADPKLRMPSKPSSSGSKSTKSKSIYTKSIPTTQKFKIKGGGAVDPASGLEDVAHVYESGKDKYTATLGITDVQSNKNSYYKLQLLQADTGNSYWLFRAWGRIGTTIGGDKVEKFDSLHEAKTAFCELYLEKSGNLWENHHNFQKVPGRMYPIDIDYGDENDVNMDIVESESKLLKPIQELIRLIFDVKKMQNLMKEYELDMEKMPLGKLSKKQIQKAYKVLTELQQLIESGGNQSRFIDATNRFYTLIPHSFGVDNVPIITDPEVIKTKIEMLDSLMELEVAYNLMKSSGSDHTVDSYYKQLNTEIGMLDRDSKEFKIIDDYVRNTHAATHSNYALEIEEIYTVKRSGEEKRYKPFKKLPNRKLLWHGSRLTNFAGILSQGLRIAPPEAPVTGYMFGKGIYFADMVSKSANYCCTSPQQPTGLLLLCEVALGDMYELLQANYIEKLPKGKHSTKGVGRTQPDPSASEFVDGVEVPIGKGKEVKNVKSSLLYNEYIVYDVAQVNVKYLLKVNFKYKY